MLPTVILVRTMTNEVADEVFDDVRLGSLVTLVTLALFYGLPNQKDFCELECMQAAAGTFRMSRIEYNNIIRQFEKVTSSNT